MSANARFSSQGWTCSYCMAFVPAGEVHVCLANLPQEVHLCFPPLPETVANPTYYRYKKGEQEQPTGAYHIQCPHCKKLIEVIAQVK